MLSASNLIRWLQRKRYQYEVTFSLYMLTPTEKFIFNTFLLLFISMIIVAASLYLPEHVMKMASRAWFYYAGDETAAGVGTRAGYGDGAARPGQGDLGKAGGRMDGQDVLNMLGSL